MPIYKPSELRSFLAAHGIRASKALSQNFLIDQNIVKKIIQEGNLDGSEQVLEIGPGPGVLTEALLQTKVSLLAVEKDKRLAKALERFQASTLKIICDDFLALDLKTVLDKEKKALCFGNIPYAITAPILFKTVPSRRFSKIILMLQTDLAKRILAPINSPDYSAFSVSMQAIAKVKIAFHVSKHCFFPEPKIQSTVINIENRDCPIPQERMNDFFAFVRQSFQQRRKKLSSNLKNNFEKDTISDSFKQLTLSDNARPQELSVEQWIKLFFSMNAKN